MMFASPQERARVLAALFALALTASPSASLAQMAPVIGDHYAARESDTGFAGAVNASGGYGTSVPLDLPTARGGLPVPLRVVYGGRRFGAAGLGWDVPLSSIRRDVRIAHRRPANNPDTNPQPREQLTLSLDGGGTALVRKADDTGWVARRNDAQLEVRDVGGGVLEAYDGNGHRYSFSSDGRNVDGSTIGPLDNGNLYMLRDIFGPGGAKVHLDYAFFAPSLGGGTGTGLVLSLTSVSYNYDATGTCPKHKINLNYGPLSAAPLSISMLGSTALMRIQVLRESAAGTAIDVMAREVAADSPQPCSGAMKALRSYNLNYQNDADTGQLQLRRVTMFGKDGTAERSMSLPVATYSYGQVTDSDGKLRYKLSQRITSLPQGFDTRYAATVTASDNPPAFTSRSWSLQNIIDINGDGRPDLLYSPDTLISSGMNAALNKPDPANPGKSLFTPIDIPARTASGGRFEDRQTSDFPRQMDVAGQSNEARRWHQMIDMNADGRVDVVVADEVADAWVIYLNTPDAQDPNRVTWVRQTIDIHPLYQYLPYYYRPNYYVDGQSFLPLSSTVTGHDKRFNHCWKGVGSQWVETLEGYDNGKCVGPQGQDPSRVSDFGGTDLSDATITQWELRDINGDGYPDFVFNASAAGQGQGANPGPDGPAINGQFRTTFVVRPFDLVGAPEVKAILNVAGVHLTSGTSAFSAPIVLDVGCGVARWTSPGVDAAGRSATVRQCGFEDVNGDGLVDRVGLATISDPVVVSLLVNAARLGTGDLSMPFSNALIQLPGPASRSESQLTPTDGLGHFRPALCPVTEPNGQFSFPNPTFFYPIKQTHGLHDINGDGLPDYVAWEENRGWTVALGTGAGFAAPKGIDSENNQFDLSREVVGCFPDNTTSGTIAGLYDFYGEGQPGIVASLGPGVLAVYSLHTSVDAGGNVVVNPPTSGLLTKIENGYGASTTIAYRSAKQDVSTNHLVPSPEVVVTAVTTQDVSGQPVSSRRYAYGNASQYFDAALDRWVFPGYRRKVSLQNTGNPSDPGAGNALITDAYPLDPFSFTGASIDATTRLLRYLKVGRTSDVTTISGGLGTDPWALLGTDVTTDARRIAASHMTYTSGTTRLLPAGRTGNEYCIDMLDPYDYTGSLNYKNNNESFDQCAERGFALQTSVTSWRGMPGTVPGTATGTADVADSSEIAKTGFSITAIDNLGRVTDITDKRDLNDPNDDLCTHTDYAGSQTSPVRVRNAVAQKIVKGCGANAPVLARTLIEYDGLTGVNAGHVTNGFVTSSTVTRYDGDTHLSLGDIRLFDTTFDAAGNPLTITRRRDDDGAISTMSFSYDAFGLVATGMTSTAVDPVAGTLPAISSSSTFDAVTLNRTSATDANGTVSGTTYDGFGRVVRSKVTPPGGAEGVLSSTSYRGFELVDTNGDGIPDSPDPTLGGRSIAQKVFQDAVPAASVATAPGRIQTTFLDSFGRVNTTKADLGANYPNKVATFRSYDALGRVNFMSDPYEDNGSQQTLYGTSYNFNTDGTPSCFVRGFGVQPVTFSVDETNEVYPTCFDRFFSGHKEVLTRKTADTLGQTNQSGILQKTIVSATGRVLERRTEAPPNPNTGTVQVYEDVLFGYDLLGHRTSMTRPQRPTIGINPAVTTTWHYDSLGWITKLEKTGGAAQTRTFDTWGNVTRVQWCDDLSAAPCPTKDRRTIARYDARNRLSHREDQANNSGQPVPGTVADLTYDVNSGALPFVPRNNMLGRLASATWGTGQEWFTYDAFGRVNSRSFVDTGVTPNDHHYEIHEFHDDGSEKTLHLELQDTNGQDERVNYGYDSAGRVNSAVYSFGGSSQTLFSASGTSPIYDAFGHIINAQYGLAQFNATYAATGRRLPTDVKVTSGDRAHSREIAFPTLNGVKPFDPVGRELRRQEFIDGSASVPPSFLYDQRGWLSHLLTPRNNGGSQVEHAFSYDALGNVLNDLTAADRRVWLDYQTPDLERVCKVWYGTAATPSACNVSYDGAGNTLTMPTRTGSTRVLDYFPNGAVKSVAEGASNASFAYDAFGALQQLTVNTPSADQRADKYFGTFIKQRIEGLQSVINRRIPVPGLIATRHGPTTGKWTFPFGEGRGTRFVADQTGNFVQGIEYQPFGEVKNPTGATPGSTNYENEQFNGGDLLAAFGVVNLGARVYDPVIGRFLSRDPIIQAKSPYAFADNDPINKIDPTGMVVTCEASTSTQSDASCDSKADQSGSPSGSSVAGESQSGSTCSGYDAGGGTQVINCQFPTSCDTFCQWDKLLADSFPLIPGVGGTNQTGGALGQLSVVEPRPDSSALPYVNIAWPAYSSGSFRCYAASSTCYTSQPTLEDYGSHWRDGTGWPVIRPGATVNLLAYPSGQFDVPAGTPVSPNPGSPVLLDAFVAWKTGGARAGDPRTDALINGHIAPSEVIGDTRYLGTGFIQLAPDRFTLSTMWGDSWLRDFETRLLWNALADGRPGKDFNTYFVGPTPVP